MSVQKEIKTESKDWTEESLILGLLVKKFGKNGLLEIDLKKETPPKSFSFSIINKKAYLYVE